MRYRFTSIPEKYNKHSFSGENIVFETPWFSFEGKVLAPDQIKGSLFTSKDWVGCSGKELGWEAKPVIK